jgi:hypothetical protein
MSGLVEQTLPYAENTWKVTEANLLPLSKPISDSSLTEQQKSTISKHKLDIEKLKSLLQQPLPQSSWNQYYDGAIYVGIRKRGVINFTEKYDPVFLREDGYFSNRDIYDDKNFSTGRFNSLTGNSLLPVLTASKELQFEAGRGYIFDIDLSVSVGQSVQSATTLGMTKELCMSEYKLKPAETGGRRSSKSRKTYRSKNTTKSKKAKKAKKANKTNKRKSYKKYNK